MQDIGTLGEAARGSIEPTEVQLQRLDQLVVGVQSWEYFVQTGALIPYGCMDGRPGGRLVPCAAGGTLSLVVAADLVGSQDAKDVSTAELTRNVFRTLDARDFPVGDHSAEGATGDSSGCGANDNLRAIYSLLQDTSEEVRQLAGIFGVRPTDEDHSELMANAARRTEFSSGSDVLQAMRDESPAENIDTLRGKHQEALIVINKRRGTVLDRDRIAQDYGDDMQLFVIDAWTFEDAAKALYPGADEAILQRAVTAIAYYQIATALTLCGPGMRVVACE
jgi:hypothetical protein